MSDNRQNILFLQSDEHSFRFSEGREPVETPTLDALSCSGSTFEQTYCQVPLCGPSRNCMLTSREQRVTGSWINEFQMISELPTLPEILGEAGYETCLVGKMHFSGPNQFHGFDHRPYGDLTGGTGHQWEPLDGEKRSNDGRQNAGITEIPESHLQEYTTMRESLAWLREHEAQNDAPWFLTASFSRPHGPTTAPRRYVARYWNIDQDEPTDRYRDPPVMDGIDHPIANIHRSEEGFDGRDDRFARACYFACVDFLDDIIGEFLSLARRDGLLDNTVIIYASDHGSMVGEHEMWWKSQWHDGSTRVPFIIETPSHRQGETGGHRIESPVSLADLFPTICGIVGVNAPDSLEGVDLSASVLEGVEPDRGPVVTDFLFPLRGPGSPWRMVRDGRWKYVRFRDAPEILYDLESDPLETENLAAVETMESDAAREALDHLQTYVDETLDFEAYGPDEIHEKYRENDRFQGLEIGLDVTATEASRGRSSGNCYLMPDGTVVQADSPLYDPMVVTDDPESTFEDWPGE